MTIVCGTDFSEKSKAAETAAAALARALKVPLKLVHALVDFTPLLEEGSSLEGVYDALRAALHDRAQALAAEAETEVEAVLVRGSPHEKLAEVARQSHARLLVVAALGAKAQTSWLLGSVAERVIQCSNVPVLVVRDAGPLCAWARGEKALKVTVGADLGPSSKAALRWAAGLREIGPCDLTVTEIAWPFGERARLGIPVLAQADRLRPEVEELLLRDLREWAGSLPGPGETSFVVSPGFGRVDTHLTLLAAEQGAELVVVGAHQRSSMARIWLGSVSRGVVHYASTNVVCVPGYAAPEETSIPTFRSVLVPTDFSALANRAIPVGYGMVAEGGVVHLVHVANGRAKGAVDAAEALRALIPPGAAARGITTEVHVIEERDAGIGIWHAAGRLGVDAICMATHGRSGLGAVVLGSQAREVVCRARQPVLLVPPERAP